MYWKRKFPIIINRNFTLLWLGHAISSIGDWTFEITLILWIVSEIAANQSWASLAVSGVYFATSLPLIIIAPFAGVLVDRWPKKIQCYGWMLCEP